MVSSSIAWLGLVVESLSRIYAGAAYVALGFEAVEPYRLVVVGERLGGVGEEEVGGSPVEVCGRILRLFLYVEVEVLHGVLEVLGEKGGDSAREIYAYLAGAQLQGAVEVPERGFVVSGTALCDCAVVIAVGEHRIQAYGSVEVCLGSAVVAEIVLGYSAEEEAPVVGGVEPRENVEVLYGKRVFPVCESLASPPHEHILIVLCEGGKRADERQRYGQKELFHYLCKDNQLSNRN